MSQLCMVGRQNVCINFWWAAVLSTKQFGDFFGLCPDLENYYLSFSKRESTCNCDFKASYYWKERKKEEKIVFN